MVDFSKDELLKLASISYLKLDDNEIEWLQDQLSKTIEYIHKIDQIESKEEHAAIKTINVFRDDKGVKKDSSPLLAQAPKTKGTYFIVPKILAQ